jgi:Domain of unknown function (DUF5666)
MIRKTLLAVLCLTLFASAASAQFTISRYSRWVVGTISGTDGTKVLLFDNRLSVEAANADIHGRYGPGTLGSLTPGTWIKAGGHVNPFTGSLDAVEVEVLPDYDALIHGQIAGIDFTAGTLDILGQTVRFTANTKVYRTSDAALVPLSDLRPLMIVDLELDRDEPGLVAETIAFAPGQANLITTTGGFVSGINGDLWTVGGVTVRVTPDTFIGGDPRLRERVLVTYRGDATGGLEAISILRISFISEEDVAGEVRAISGQTITIDTGRGATTLQLDAATRYRGVPQVGDVVVARVDGNDAKLIELVWATDFTFTFGGEVTSIHGNDWMVQGVPFTVTSTTRVTGSPQVGDTVTVTSFEVNGLWYAMTVDTLSFNP